MGVIIKYIDEVPETLRPITASIIDGVYEGLLDNTEAIADAIIDGKFSDAYVSMLTGLDTRSLTSVLEKINNESAMLISKHKRVVDNQKEIVKQLIRVALGFLRKAVYADAGSGLLDTETVT